MDGKQPRRKKPPRKRRPGEDAAILTRVASALALRIRGWRYREIAAELLVSEKTAYYDVQEALGSLDVVVKDKAERLRELEIARCDRLLASLDAGIESGDPRAVVAAVRIAERRAKLLGLDAPTTVTGPSGEPVNVMIIHKQLSD